MITIVPYLTCHTVDDSPMDHFAFMTTTLDHVIKEMNQGM